MVGDREDAGFFISGSTDCSVSVNVYDMELCNTRLFHLPCDPRNELICVVNITCPNMQVKIWDPSLRGSELRATLKGHTRFSLSLILHSFMVVNIFQ